MINIAVIGGAFAGNLHAEAINRTVNGRVCAGVARSVETRSTFGSRWKVPTFATLTELFEKIECDAVSIAVPNYLHRELVELAAQHGVSVIVEKPLASTYADAAAMVKVCEESGVFLLYAEQLCFAPRYVRVKELIEEGAFGQVIQLNHWERHGGPHADWFYDPDKSGGGVALDMGCHGIALTRWLNGNRPVVEVSATMGTYLHRDRLVEDHALITLKFDNEVIAVVDSSWAAPGGIDERIEVLGTGGSVSADLARGQSLLAYSENGFDGAAEKTTHHRGLVRIPHDEAYTWGWFGEFEHFVEVLAGTAQPALTGGDGLEILGIVSAAYAAAAQRRVVTPPWPIDPGAVGHAWLSRS